MIVKSSGRSVTIRMRFSCRLSKKRQAVAVSRVWVSRFSSRCCAATGTWMVSTAAAISTGDERPHAPERDGQSPGGEEREEGVDGDEQAGGRRRLSASPCVAEQDDHLKQHPGTDQRGESQTRILPVGGEQVATSRSEPEQAADETERDDDPRVRGEVIER